MTERVGEESRDRQGKEGTLQWSLMSSIGLAKSMSLALPGILPERRKSHGRIIQQSIIESFTLSVKSFRSPRQPAHFTHVDEGDSSSGDLW